MAWKDLSYDKKVTLSNLVSVACTAHNIEWLKKVLPTAQDLLEYRDMHNGGGVLHTLMYAHDTKEKSSSVDFLKEILKAYDIENNSELKEALFMKRNTGGKLAADFTYVEKFLHPDSKKAFADWRGHDVSQMTDLTDRRTQGEKNKIALYLFIKDQVLSIKNETTKEQAHAIIKPYQDRSGASVDQFEKGTPVSNALYLGQAQENGLYVVGSAHEEYPEIRLRNFQNETGKEDYCVLRGLRPDSPESLLSQAIDKIDFPEDYGEKYFYALQVFEDDYKRLKENEGLAATYRYFNENRGAVVFEGGEEKIDSNGGKGSYGGYFTPYQTQENGKNVGYPIIVIPCYSLDDFRVKHKFQEKYKDMWASSNERPLYHELFHAIDLGFDTHFSEMPIFQYAMMLAETDKNNKITDPFRFVANYQASEYHKEMAAQIMGIADDSVLEKSPLLQRIHKLGQYFAIAKQTGKTGVVSSLSIATQSFLEDRDLRIANDRFMAAKKEKETFEFDADKRKKLEDRFIKLLDKTIAKTENSLGISPHDQNMTQQTR